MDTKTSICYWEDNMAAKDPAVAKVALAHCYCSSSAARRTCARRCFGLAESSSQNLVGAALSGVFLWGGALSVYDGLTLATAVWLRDGHFYRILPKHWPYAGAVQRAAEARFCGITGHLVTSASAEEDTVIRAVVRESAPPLEMIEAKRSGVRSAFCSGLSSHCPSLQ